MRLPDAFVSLADRATQLVYRLTAGWLGEKQLSYSMLLLHTIGRKTGRRRTHTLLYISDGEDLIVCASNNGQPHHPAWYWNLKSEPHASVQAGRRHYSVVAQLATGEHYERLWQHLLAVRPQYADYRTRTTRAFPIVILRPVHELRTDR
jgi:deazaflavin-dependent oxidoreductase (nitroreductase family)